jgi:alkanesulfonate monooxygenase SsuD/methylene tetrahydromethanopterin reductase-like flavin-dependent oxidoreductase (luciferase family)
MPAHQERFCELQRPESGHYSSQKAKKEGRSVQFAIGLPNVKEYADPRLLVGLAVEAEASGWDGVFVWDHLLYRDETDGVVDPWVSVAAIAQATETVRIGVMVAALARRRPWTLAREAAAVDVLSDGRLIFGAGLGSLGDEFRLFGENPDKRVRADKLDEALDIVTGLWVGESFSYESQHYSVGPVRFLPTPRQAPRIPVWIAGRWPNRRPFRRAARWDGVFATHEEVGHNETMSVEQLTAIVDYTLTHRSNSTDAFDVVIEGQTSERDQGGDAERVAAYTEAGLTWWVEKLGWFRGTVDETRARIAAGPPTSRLSP